MRDSLLSQVFRVMLAILVVNASLAMTGAAEDPPATAGTMFISSRLINHLAARPVVDSFQVEETLQGTYTTGTAVTRAVLAARLVPQEDAAAVDLRLVGKIVMEDGTGYHGRIVIRSSCQSQINATKRIIVTPSAVRTAPATAQCQSTIQILDISAPRQFVERLAYRRVYRTQGEIEAEASQRTEERTTERLDQEIAQQLADTDKLGREKLGSALDRLNLPERVRMGTTDQWLYASARPLLVAAAHPLQRPAPTVPKHDANFRVHETLVVDVCQALLAGSDVTDRQLLDFMKLLVGVSPRPLWVHARTPRWSLALAERPPLVVRFVDGGLTLGVRIKRLTIGTRKYDEPLIVTAAYTLKATPDGPLLERKGDITVDFERRPPMEQGLADARALLRRKFQGVFLPEIYFDGLVPPAGSEWNSFRQLDLKELTSNQGWLTMGYDVMPGTNRLSAHELSEVLRTPLPD